MNSYFQKIYDFSPLFLQNLFVTLYNLKYNRKRYAGNYQNAKDYFKKWQYLPIKELQEEQENRLSEFLKYVRCNSLYYRQIIPQKNTYSVFDLQGLPTISKDDLIENFDTIRTVSETDGLVSFTGGTTGASLKVLYKWEDVQERRAFLDLFWEQYGYKHGSKTAWFSGKHIIPKEDSKILWRTDFINHIRYYSTFHITKSRIRHYIDSLNEFKPEFMVGFPSSVYEIARLGLEENLQFNGQIRCFFPTAESLVPEEVKVIQEFFKCEVRNQYASSEGAPFLTECSAGNLHYDMLTGIMEVVDENLEPTREGELLVTSFTTRGTPLIRYRIGDRIRWHVSNEPCSCGRNTPRVESIFGRSNDYVLSADHGRVNLGNISNCTKGVKGILRFQIIQENSKSIDVLVVPGRDFSDRQKEKFLSNLKSTLGSAMSIRLFEVESIQREKSGKYRIVKNKVVR